LEEEGGGVGVEEGEGFGLNEGIFQENEVIEEIRFESMKQDSFGCGEIEDGGLGPGETIEDGEEASSGFFKTGDDMRLEPIGSILRRLTVGGEPMVAEGEEGPVVDDAALGKDGAAIRRQH